VFTKKKSTEIAAMDFTNPVL